jgi:hypothetical protein
LPRLLDGLGDGGVEIGRFACGLFHLPEARCVDVEGLDRQEELAVEEA